MSDRGKLGNFLKEVINWNWKEFCDAEKDPNYTGLEATVLSLVRSTSESKLGAIRLAIDRVDGKIETPVKVEYPKVFFLYPFAKEVAPPSEDVIAKEIEAGETSVIKEGQASEEPKEDSAKLATMSLRETLNKMAESPRQVVPLILSKKKQVEDKDWDGDDAPLVKSVIAANLLHLANEQNNFDAITEVFDQIDGKLVETIKILGDDVYMTQYSETAPYGSVLNSDGVYMLEAISVQETLKEKLKRDGK